MCDSGDVQFCSYDLSEPRQYETEAYFRVWQESVPSAGRCVSSTGYIVYQGVLRAVSTPSATARDVVPAGVGAER